MLAAAIYQETLWKLTLGVLTLAGFAIIGIGCLISPEWGIRHFGRGLRQGGELQTEWNRVGIALAGLAFAAGSVYVLFEVLRDYLRHP